MPRAQQTNERFFTVDEANRTLPLVKMVVDDIVETHREIEDLRREYDDLRKSRKLPKDQLPPADSDLYRMDESLMVKMLKIQSFAKEIEEIGGVLSHVGDGEVDFPTLVEGREMVLCWRRGEDRIGHWHDPSESQPRRPLPAGVL